MYNEHLNSFVALFHSSDDIIQAKDIWKQDPEANIWALERLEWGVVKAPQWETSLFAQLI